MSTISPLERIYQAFARARGVDELDKNVQESLYEDLIHLRRQYLYLKADGTNQITPSEARGQLNKLLGASIKLRQQILATHPAVWREIAFRSPYPEGNAILSAINEHDTDALLWSFGILLPVQHAIEQLIAAGETASSRNNNREEDFETDSRAPRGDRYPPWPFRKAKTSTHKFMLHQFIVEEVTKLYPFVTQRRPTFGSNPNYDRYNPTAPRYTGYFLPCVEAVAEWLDPELDRKPLGETTRNILKEHPFRRTKKRSSR